MIHHHGFLADYSRLDSPVHRLPVSLKFFVAIGLVIAIVLVPMSHVLFFVSCAIVVIVVAVISRIPPFFLIRRISMAEPIVLGAAVLSLFQPGGGHIFLQIVVKSSLCLCWTILLSNTTPFADLIDLMRRLRVPGLLVTTLALMYRYLFVLRDEASRMKRARASRTFNRDSAHAWKMIASVIGQLLVRAHERAERLYVAMCAQRMAVNVTPSPEAVSMLATEKIRASSPVIPAIQVKNLHFHYDTSDGQIHDISFAIEEGECVGLIGPNGAGKSTLLLHLNGVLPDAFNGPASVFIFGQAVGAKTLRAVRRQVGFLFQDPDDQLFCPTVYEDVALGPKQFGWPAERISVAVSESLERVGMSGFEKRNPHHLSGGEKRRACLAGILACEPRILVLDEPTSNLDPRGRRQVMSLLRKIPATKLIAAHDLDMVAELCSRVIVLDGGQIVGQGPARELLDDEELMLKHGLERPPSLGCGK